MDFTAVRPAVNLDSRLEGLCRRLGRPVMISGALAAEPAAPLVLLGEHATRLPASLLLNFLLQLA